MESKACNKCTDVKPLEDFPPHSKAQDGRDPQCRKCRNEARHKPKRINTEEDSSETKACSLCGKERPLKDFHRNKQGKNGRLSSCKKCRQDRYRTPQKIDIPTKVDSARINIHNLSHDQIERIQEGKCTVCSKRLSDDELLAGAVMCTECIGAKKSDERCVSMEDRMAKFFGKILKEDHEDSSHMSRQIG